MMLRTFSLALLPVLLGSAPAPRHHVTPGEINTLTLSSAAGTARLAIAADRGIAVRESQLHQPDRLVLDFEPAVMGTFASYDGRQRGLVSDIRVTQHSPTVVRVVLEFDHMPDYRVEQNQDGLVTVSFADKPFDAWNSTQPVAGQTTAATADRPVITSEPEPRFTGHTERLRQDSSRFDVTWDKTPIEDAVNQLALRSGTSIVLGKDVTGTVSMTVRNKTWRQIFDALLAQQGLSAAVMEGGIIRVDAPEALSKVDSLGPLEARVVRLNYARATEMADVIKGMLTKSRGTVTADSSTNSLVIVDTRTRTDDIVKFVEGLDLKTPTVSIEAKLIFVDRTDLQQLGVKYDIGTSRQFFNQIVQRTDPTTGQPFNPNVNVVNLGGNSVSAISNADALISGSALDLVFSTAIGGFSVSSFLSALQQVELTDIQAQPIINTLDNRQAMVLSGEETPVRVIDASSFGQVNQAPRANVQFKETGIKLLATPHVTGNNQIVLDLDVERSFIQPLAAADLGFNIPIQHTTSRLLVNDGETAVIAGLNVTTVTRNRSGIPLLSSLPFIGNLFSFTTNSEHHQDLIVLVTPRILNDPIQ